MAGSWIRRVAFSGLLLALGFPAAARTGEESAVDALLNREKLRVQQVQREAAEALAHAREMRTAERYADALSYYTQAERLDPANAEAQRGRLDMERRLASSVSARSAVVGAMERTKIMTESASITADNALDQAKAHFAEASAPVAKEDADNVDRLPKALGNRKRALQFALSRLSDAEAHYRMMPPQVATGPRLAECAQLRTQMETLGKELQGRITVASAQQAARAIRESQKDIGKAQSANIQEWRDKAEQAYKRRDWDQARQYLKAILSERDYDTQAKRRLKEVNDAALADMDRQTTAKQRIAREEIQRKIDDSTANIPPPGVIMTYPPDWAAMLQKQRAKEVGKAAKADEETAKVFTKLHEQRSVGFQQATIDDFCNWLADQTELSVEHKGVDAATTINLAEVSNMRLETILNKVTSIAKLTWRPWYGGILIQSAGAGGDMMETVTIDIKDLMINPKKVRKPTKIAMEGVDDEDDEDDEDADENAGLSDYTSYAKQDSLAAFIHLVMGYAFGPYTGTGGGTESGAATAVTSATGYEGGKLLLNKRDKLLTATARPRDIQVLQQLLKDMRSTKQMSVSTMVRFLEMSDEFWEEFDSSFTGLDTSTYPTTDPRFNSFGRKDTWQSDSHYGETRDVNRDWTLSSRMNSSGPYADIFGSRVAQGNGGMSMALSGFGWLGKTNAKWMLRAVKESTKADVLFAPHVVCYNNNTGLVEQLRLIQDAFAAGSSSGEGMNLQRVTYPDGISLRVRPLVSNDRKYITIYLDPRLTEVGAADVMTYSFNGFPYKVPMRGMMITETKTYATIPNGGTVLLSGMSINVQMRSRNGVPVLQDIPILGAAFSRRALQRDKRNFMTMVSSDIILLDEEEAKATAPLTTASAN